MNHFGDFLNDNFITIVQKLPVLQKLVETFVWRGQTNARFTIRCF
ncbi:hypothetical protein J2W55_000515 [Mucilaginibacter pocheonensis]|uniref:Uncharacterized protein n=1 Tax=Mucilaginibacter pocheonensis TaxID=398050 RepID=A0ABU1T5M9_9SPHI|nr:hypothetical protein [Mucilaginibacter pocheonensis]